MFIFEYIFEKLLQNSSSVEDLIMYGCHVPLNTSSGPSTIWQGTLHGITQSFRNNHSLDNVILIDISKDIFLAKAVLEGLACHSNLTSIYFSGYLK